MNNIKLSLKADEENYCRLSSNYTELDGKWEDIYVNISGHFGGFNPKMFQYAPEMFEALKDIVEEFRSSNRVGLLPYPAAISRAMVLLDLIEESGNE